MRLAVVAFFLLASVLFAAPAAASAAVPCRAVSLRSLGAGAAYVATFYDARETSAETFATFYGGGTVYSARFRLPLGGRPVAIAFSSHSARRLLGAAFTFGDDSSSCVVRTSVRDVSPAEERDSTTYVPSEGAAPVNLTKAGTSDPARCPAPFSAAQISAAAPVLYPDIAREQGATGVAVVLVAVAPDGSSAATQVVTSSGSGALDESASHAARATKYRAAVFDCEPIADSFLFHAEFTIQTDAKPLSLPLP